MIERRREMGGSNLPYAYKVEYLVSSGTQYIDTGYYPNYTTRALCGFSCVFSDTGIFGMRDASYKGSNDFDCIAYDTNQIGLIWRFNSGNIQFPDAFPFVNNKRYDISVGNSYVKIDGSLYSTATTIAWQSHINTLTIFARKINYHEVYCGASKIYYLKITEDGVLLLDYIPVVDKQGIPAMYDKVSGQLFYNQGTGQFITGPRV